MGSFTIHTFKVVTPKIKTINGEIGRYTALVVSVNNRCWNFGYKCLKYISVEHYYLKSAFGLSFGVVYKDN